VSVIVSITISMLQISKARGPSRAMTAAKDKLGLGQVKVTRLHDVCEQAIPHKEAKGMQHATRDVEKGEQQENIHDHAEASRLSEANKQAARGDDKAR
jgi:hypothetical protein